MHKKKLIIISSFVLIIALVTFGYFVFFADNSNSMSEEDARDFVRTNYGGTISSISQKDSEMGLMFSIVFENDTGVYKIELHKKTSKVVSLSQQSVKDNTQTASLIQEEEAKKLIQDQINGDLLTIEEISQDSTPYYSFIIKADSKDTAYLLNRQSGEITEDSAAGSTEYISKEKAEELALQEISGDITEIDLEEDDDFGLVYELEIETASNKEVKMYINAYTGAIESINWEND